MDNGKLQFDFKQFNADTHFTMQDILPELAAFTILWHDLGYGNDPVSVAENKDAHMLTMPFVNKIRKKLRDADRWPEERDARNCGMLTGLLMVKAASITPERLQNLRDVIIDSVISHRIF